MRYALVAWPIGLNPAERRSLKQNMRDRLHREGATSAKAMKVTHREGNWLFQILRIEFEKDT